MIAFNKGFWMEMNLRIRGLVVAYFAVFVNSARCKVFMFFEKCQIYYVVFVAF